VNMAVRMVQIQALVAARPQLFAGQTDDILERAKELAAKDGGFISSEALPGLIGEEATDQLFNQWEKIPALVHDPPLNDNDEQLVADFGTDFCERRMHNNPVSESEYVERLPTKAAQVAFKALIAGATLLTLSASATEALREEGKTKLDELSPEALQKIVRRVEVFKPEDEKGELDA
jgi:hypothetical protein